MGDLTAVIVDDDQDLSPILSELLTANRIKLAGLGFSGNDVVRLVKANKPDIVFLDITTPKLDVIYTIKEIRKHDTSVHIVVTTNGNEDAKDLLYHGANSIIYKPFDRQKIDQVIGEIKLSIPKMG